ncbi:hypothetical protein E2C01_031898 [Portunus trituberculatus]|uniref:Uncharacterized protein n=1 Tax=Portunus trituberculatus TaxID=210409 RepID=A0A5B7EVZ9_PORTR|nr:hypothetical protein [Portunus trituberculatus]
MINRRDHRIHHHVRLSLFVLAELIDTLPNPQQFNAAPAPRLGPADGWVWAWSVGVAMVLAGRVVGGHSTGFGNLQVLVESVEEVLGGFSHVLRRTKAALPWVSCKASLDRIDVKGEGEGAASPSSPDSRVAHRCHPTSGAQPCTNLILRLCFVCRIAKHSLGTRGSKHLFSWNFLAVKSHPLTLPLGHASAGCPSPRGLQHGGVERAGVGPNEASPSALTSARWSSGPRRQPENGRMSFTRPDNFTLCT